MAASGPIPTIYAAMDPDVSLSKLKKALEAKLIKDPNLAASSPKLWLLRESRRKGCLTVDFVEYKDGIVQTDREIEKIVKNKDGTNRTEKIITRNCLRIATITDAEGNVDFRFVGESENLTIAREDKGFVSMSRGAVLFSEDKSNFARTLVAFLEKKGYTSDAYLAPSLQEKTRNEAYDFPAFMDAEYDPEMVQRFSELLKSHRELGTCSIELESIEGPAAILPSGHVVKSEVILDWLAIKPTNPFTNLPMTEDDLLITSAFERRRGC